MMHTRLLLLLALLAMSLNALHADAGTTGSPPTQMPPPPEWLPAMDALYDAQLRADGLDDRAFPPDAWWDVAMPLLTRERGFTTEDIGRSVEDRPLRHATWGSGETRVFLWSQMHGDESTGSMALADLFRLLGEHPHDPVVQRLRAETTLHFFPMVNPDGAARFQRRNAQGIDINRDARNLASPEARTLKSLFDQVQPHFGFNLHDQRAGYRVGDTERGTAIALLAPPYNAANEVNATRRKAMEVSAVIRTTLEPYIAGHIARWDETFNPRAFGDLTAQWGAGTVLIEAGGIEGDPQKQRLRKLYFLSLVAALDSIATGSHAGIDTALYSDLSENGDVWPDLLIRNGTIASPGLPPARTDVLVNFRDPLAETGGSINDIGDQQDTRARHVIDAQGLYIVPITHEGATASRRIAPGVPARLHLARDPEGRDIVWTLDRDVDPAHPRPGTTR